MIIITISLLLLLLALSLSPHTYSVCVISTNTNDFLQMAYGFHVHALWLPRFNLQHFAKYWDILNNNNNKILCVQLNSTELTQSERHKKIVVVSTELRCFFRRFVYFSMVVCYSNICFGFDFAYSIPAYVTCYILCTSILTHFVRILFFKCWITE